MSVYQAELQMAIAAVQKAAALCSSVQQNLITADTVEKKDKSPVTIADLGTQALVTLALRRAFPADRLVGEEDSNPLTESADVAQKVLDLINGQMPETTHEQMIAAVDFGTAAVDFNGRYWTLDPIDGTKGFLRGDQYAIALALIEDGQVVLGVLGCPNYPLGDSEKGAIFYAVKGQGCYQLPLDGGKAVQIQSDGLEDASQARFCESVEAAHAAHDVHAQISAEVGITQPPFRIDSQCKYAAVARGDASVYLRLPRSLTYREKIWDHAAGVIVVQEAGGRVSDFSGKPLNFAKGRKLEDNLGILVTNGKLHSRTLAAIKTTVELS